MATESITEIAASLREAFPSLDEKEIAALTLEERKNVLARVQVATAAPTTTAVPTVLEIVEIMREQYMRKEKRRIRAKLQPDGSIHIKDTTTYRTYDTHWKKLVEAHGDKLITEVTKKMVREFAEAAQDHALATHDAQNNNRLLQGKTAREYTGGRSHNLALDAVSVILMHAVEENYIPHNVARNVPREKKNVSNRQALTQQEVEEIMETVIAGGNDPILDYLLLWSLSETACRRGGLVKLQLGDVTTREGFPCLQLFEKGNSNRFQPVTQVLHDTLIEFAHSRGSTKPVDPVFRYHPDSQGRGGALTAKRFETLWNRVKKELAWVEKMGVSSHWLRHTTITWVDRAFNPTIAQAFAGHAAANVTAVYSTAKLHDIANAHAALTGTSDIESKR